MSIFRKSPRVSRREAAAILRCSVDNIRKLDRTRRLLTGRKGPDGAYTYERSEIEAFAKQIERRKVDDGVLTAHVFKMFKRGVPHDEICIETQQASSTIRELHIEYRRGFGLDDPREVREREEQERRDERERREREEERAREDMRAFEAELRALVEPTTPSRPTSAKESVDADRTRDIAERSLAKAREILKKFGGKGGGGGSNSGEGNAAE